MFGKKKTSFPFPFFLFDTLPEDHTGGWIDGLRALIQAAMTVAFCVIGFAQVYSEMLYRGKTIHFLDSMMNLSRSLKFFIEGKKGKSPKNSFEIIQNDEDQEGQN